MDEKLKEYANRFGQNFPVFFFRNKSEEEIIKMVEGCLDRNEPLQMDDNGADDA